MSSFECGDIGRSRPYGRLLSFCAALAKGGCRVVRCDIARCERRRFAAGVAVFHYGMFVGLPALLLEPGSRRVYTELIEQACS